ncbi:MAG: hypothetical protein M1823_007150, partial [Watsoniomyces obsoletus]
MRSRFVWNDGVLVDAVQEGYWLVLDNANLCNASVLDRLNSLLEPDGQLIISEQHNADGGVRKIKPHPDFRIILTVDPRYGELSRAMRNRSLEVFLDQAHDQKPAARVPMYPWTASVSRLRGLLLKVQDQGSAMPFLDNLSWADLELLKMQLSPQLGSQQLFMGLRPIIEGYVAGNENIWPRIQEQMSLLQNVKPPQALVLGYQPQQLILNAPMFSGLDARSLRS